MIGLPPSSTGTVHFIVSEVARVSAAEDMRAGGPGFSGRNLIYIIYFYFHLIGVYYMMY